MKAPTTSVEVLAGVDTREDAGLVDCPLCEVAVTADELRAHVKRDSEEIRQYVLSVIRTNHPKWVESDGSCEKCWEYYENL